MQENITKLTNDKLVRKLKQCKDPVKYLCLKKVLAARLNKIEQPFKPGNIVEVKIGDEKKFQDEAGKEHCLGIKDPKKIEKVKYSIANGKDEKTWQLKLKGIPKYCSASLFMIYDPNNRPLPY